MAKRISFFLLKDKILIYSLVHLIHFYRDNWVWPHQVTFEELKKYRVRFIILIFIQALQRNLPSIVSNQDTLIVS